MYKYNRSNRLVVYGEWGPGGEKHHLLKAISGKWEKGIIKVGDATQGDFVYTGYDKTMEVWGIKLDNTTPEEYSPESHQREVNLFELWENFDQLMEPVMLRSKVGWWPENAEPILGENGYEQANFYVLPSCNPHLKNLYDSPHPNDQYDIKKLWNQQLKGEKKYEECQFISLIKDFTFEECNEMFKSLPKITPFLNKLETFYNEMAYEDGSLLKKEGDRMFGYVIPKEEHKISPTEAEELAIKDITQKSLLLKRKRQTKGAKFLGSLTFEIVEENENIKNEWPGDYMETVNDYLGSSIRNKQDWYYYIKEACYGLASNYIIIHFLMSDYSRIKYDFGIPYALWKGGWDYIIKDNTCYVFES